jgi:hypothetical protein
MPQSQNPQAAAERRATAQQLKDAVFTAPFPPPIDPAKVTAALAAQQR